jgi:hypothetical protein
MAVTWDIGTQDSPIADQTTAEGRQLVGGYAGQHDWRFAWSAQFQVPGGVISKLRLKFKPTTVWLSYPFRIAYNYGSWDTDGCCSAPRTSPTSTAAATSWACPPRVVRTALVDSGPVEVLRGPRLRVTTGDMDAYRFVKDTLRTMTEATVVPQYEREERA